MTSRAASHPFSHLPVLVVGGGPIGLAAAAHLRARGLEPVVVEAGPEAGAGIRSWGHVRVFSPWKHMVDPLARERLEATGWHPPDPDALPTGHEFVDGWLQPLAADLGDDVVLGTRVTSVARYGVDKTRTAHRERLPFQVEAVGPDGPRRWLARAVIDASGTLGRPNPLAANGMALAGEGPGVEGLVYGIPDVLGAERSRFAGRRTLVVGGGHSAFNSLLSLVQLGRTEPGTDVTWVLRRADTKGVFGGEEADELPARGRLGARMRKAVAEGSVRLEAGFRAIDLRRADGGFRVSDGERDLGPFDQVVVNTGYRPDLGILSELRLGLDPALESPTALAPLIDPNVHSCGTVYPHGRRELSHPEPHFWMVGMKSYGRAPTFLLLTGYEQVRSVAAAIAGDLEAADTVHLELPETGVCSSSAGGGCC